MGAAEAARYSDGRTVVIAEEKVDGANLGFSLSAQYEVRVQNRSHYVNAESHPQFRPLAGWLEEHSWALCQLLLPEVEVLFGEWLCARHSVSYTRLPGYFMAFDIYNKSAGAFVSAAERDRRLEGLGIPVVRTLARRAFAGADDLLALLESYSAYGDGRVEGAYLRIDDDAQPGFQPAAALLRGRNAARGKRARASIEARTPRRHELNLLARAPAPRPRPSSAALREQRGHVCLATLFPAPGCAAVVRPDFIQGIEQHWMSSDVVRNGVRPDLFCD